MSNLLDQIRAGRLQRERRARGARTFVLPAIVLVTFVGGLLFRGLNGSEPQAVGSAAGNHPSAAPPVSSPPTRADDPSIEQTLQDATGLAASLLASTQSTEVARSALVAAQHMTGCAPKEGGPALVHVGNRTEKAAELASRADFYSTAADNGREYATHARAYADRGTIVHVAAAWECS